VSAVKKGLGDTSPEKGTKEFELQPTTNETSTKQHLTPAPDSRPRGSRSQWTSAEAGLGL